MNILHQHENKIFVHEDCHIFNIIDRLAKNDLSIIPVLDKENRYKGCIAQGDLFQYFGDIFTFEFPGSIIELNIAVRDYSLQEISQQSLLTLEMIVLLASGTIIILVMPYG